jgi:hypothetical protein
MSSTVATLECVAQVSAVAIRMHNTGSPVMDRSKARTAGAFSAGARVSISMCSASRINPIPIATLPRSLIRLRAPERNATRPMIKRAGATAVMLKDRTWTIRVVPTFAPSMIANAGTRPIMPLAANEAVMSPVAVLLWRSAVNPAPTPKAAKRLESALSNTRRRSDPNARTIPLWTMCRPQSSNATPPIKSRRTIVPIRPPSESI